MTGTPTTARPWRVPPIAGDRRLAWPEGFGTRFVVTVDTEEEFDWSLPFSREERSVSAIAALPAFHRRLAAHGIVPIYLLDHPVASDARARETIGAMLTNHPGDIGAQLHPWVNPPFEERPGDAASFAGNLGIDLETRKLDALITAIGEGFGKAPLTYRAGRYGLGQATASLLASRGFRIDSSMRSRFDYSRAGGVDFREVGPDAFYLSGNLIELPVTTIFTGALHRAGPSIYPRATRIARLPGVLSRTRMLSRVPLTPEGVALAEAKAAIDQGIADGVRLFVLSFHSPSLVPGHTPYVRDRADLARFDAWWEGMLAFLPTRHVAPASQQEIVDAGIEGLATPPARSLTPDGVGL